MVHLDSEVKEECLREDLKFYFMNPCEKYRARRQIPWKLGLQILKIVMVTMQVPYTILFLTPKGNYFMFLYLTFVSKSPYSSSKNCKIMFVWRADGMLKFSLEDNLILVSDHEVTSPRS
jgi:hypothetical protein